MREKNLFLVKSILATFFLFFVVCSIAEPVRFFRDGTLSPTTSSTPDEGNQLNKMVMSKAKQATVLIKVNSNDGKYSGSGFIFKKVDDILYIATNVHVIESAISENSSIQVVLNSGSIKERIVSAEIAGIDLENDVAILSIIAPDHKSVFTLEKLSYASETMGVFVLGFPFGTFLSASSHNPAVTVSKGWVSSIRKDDYGNVKLIQVDACINPGNSGGPVINSKGNLFGIAFAKISESQIGFVIPIQRLVELSNGKISQVEITSVETKNLHVSVHIKFLILDPFHLIQQLRIAYYPTNSKHIVVAKPLKQGYWAPLRQGEKMKIANGHWAGMNGYATLALPSKKGANLLVQPEFTSMDGAVHAMEVTLLKDPLQLWKTSTHEQTRKPGKHTRPATKERGGNWLGGGHATSSYKRHSTLQFGPLKIQRFPVLDAKVTLLPIENNIDNMFWADDGNYLVVATGSGVIYKIPVSSAASAKFLKKRINTNIKHFAKSSLGFVALNDKMQEIDLIKESDLTTIAAIPVGSCKLLTASPKSDKVFVSDGRSELKLVDLKAKTIEHTFYASNVWQDQGSFIRKNKNSVLLSNWTSIQMTPDCRYLFCASFGCLHRFKIKGDELIYEEMGPSIGNSGGRIEVSSDSNYISLINGGGNSRIAGYPQMSYGIYIFQVSDLQAPVLSVIPGAYPRALAFDPGHNRLYSSNFEKNLLRFDNKGNIIREYKLDKRGNETKQILAHPHENMLALRTKKHVFLVKFKH